MADTITVTVEDKAVLARFSPAGIPTQVRNNLRRVIPDLLRQFTGFVDNELSVLKSRTHLQFIGGPQGQMIENPQQVVGRAEMGWTGDPKKSFVPIIIEKGSHHTRPIRAVNAQALAFFWPKVNKMIFVKAVGLSDPSKLDFPGIHYMQRAFDALGPHIRESIQEAVDEGLKA
jgi:hypothetical protein